MKDLQWMKDQLEKDYADGKRVQSRIKDGEKIEGIDIKSYWRGSQTANYIARCYLEDLDEPEVLSQKWISENVEYAYFDMLDGSGRLSSATAIIKPEDLQNLLVPKQELPVIPKFVAEWIETEKRRNNSLGYSLYKLEGFGDVDNEDVDCWAKTEGSTEKLARAWLDGFTIANEDEELWKPIENYEGLYEVSNKGNVRSLDRDVQYKKTDFTMKIKGVDLKPNVLKKGYLQVGLSKNGKRKSMLVHRLVMNAFNPTTDENLQINHIDGNKENNEVSNLEWVTAIENTNHAYDTGLRDDTIGNNRKLTEDEVLEIIDLYETGNYTQKELGNKYNIGRNTVGEILLGKTWSWLTGITKEIEQEPKYYAKIKGHENIGSNDKYWNYNTDMEELSVGDSEVHPNVISEYTIKATKDEWANLGINDDNADFVKVEELEE